MAKSVEKSIIRNKLIFPSQTSGRPRFSLKARPWTNNAQPYEAFTGSGKQRLQPDHNEAAADFFAITYLRIPGSAVR
jgi:hypothetical protein